MSCICLFVDPIRNDDSSHPVSCSPFYAEIYRRANYLSTITWLPPTADDAPNLKFIQFISAGVNHIAHHPIYTDSKIPLLSANGVHGPQIAEWVVMMFLIHNHKYVSLYEQQKQRLWKQDTGRGVTDAPGKTVGILGYGSIGRQGELPVIFSYSGCLFLFFPRCHSCIAKSALRMSFLSRLRPLHWRMFSYSRSRKECIGGRPCIGTFFYLSLCTCMDVLSKRSLPPTDFAKLRTNYILPAQRQGAAKEEKRNHLCPSRIARLRSYMTNLADAMRTGRVVLSSECEWLREELRCGRRTWTVRVLLHSLFFPHVVHVAAFLKTFLGDELALTVVMQLLVWRRPWA